GNKSRRLIIASQFTSTRVDSMASVDPDQPRQPAHPASFLRGCNSSRMWQNFPTPFTIINRRRNTDSEDADWYSLHLGVAALGFHLACSDFAAEPTFSRGDEQPCRI